MNTHLAAAGTMAAALLLGGAAAPAASESPAAFAATVALVTEPQTGQGLYRVTLPLALLRHARHADRRDVRIFNAAGEPLPFAWAGVPPVPEAAPPRRFELPRFEWPAAARDGAPVDDEVQVEMRRDGTVVRVRRRGTASPQPAADGAATDWLLDLSALAQERPVALELHWPAAEPGLVRAVTALASADARVWRPVGEGTVLELRDPAIGQTALQRRVALRRLQAAERYLRLQFDAPLALQSVAAEMPLPVPELPLDSERFRLARDTARTWTLDTGAALPVRRLQVHVVDANSVLPLTIARRRPGAPAGRSGEWSPLGSHTAYRLERDGRIVTSPPLQTDGHAAQEWRLTLDERVTAPDSGLDLTLWWPAVELVFAARGPGPFQLALGRDAASAVAIDRSVLIPGYVDGAEFELPAVGLGAVVVRPEVSPTWKEALRQAGPEQRRRWVLWGVLAAAVVVLALLALRLARDLRGGQPPASGH